MTLCVMSLKGAPVAQLELSTLILRETPSSNSLDGDYLHLPVG